MKFLYRLITIAALVFSFSAAIAESLESITSGEWVKKEQRVRGGWAIVEKTDGHYLELDEKFRTRRAPDLQLILSKLSVEEANNSNALEGGLLVAELESARGSQSYKLPENYTEYRTLLLHCVEFSKLWGAVHLTK